MCDAVQSGPSLFTEPSPRKRGRSSLEAGVSSGAEDVASPSLGAYTRHTQTQPTMP